ncbi:MAG TPA: YhjD/YihY/BrkB family envelope integrity protein [Nitrospiraceae bacterium]|jgi:membrane protein|nr:YhjD/YihY/BrkB family envelope integrity protein [Nitrospiraceae bacterium]
MIRPLRFMSGVMTEFCRLGCASLAASVASFFLLSLFPMVFLLLYAVGFLVSQNVIGHQFLLSFLKGFLPSLGAGLADEIRHVAELEPVRWIVLLAFAWFGTLVFIEIDYTINVVFGSSRHRHPLISTVVAVVLFGAIELLLIVTYVATQTIDALVAHAPRAWSLDLVAVAAHTSFSATRCPSS